MYATEPTTTEPPLLFKVKPDSETASSIPANIDWKKNPTTCKQRGCEVLLVQTRLRFQQSNT